MTEKKWAFDADKFLDVYKTVQSVPSDDEDDFPESMLFDFIQSACESHAKVEVRKLAEEIKKWTESHQGDCDYSNSHISEFDIEDKINQALASRGIKI